MSDNAAVARRPQRGLRQDLFRSVDSLPGRLDLVPRFRLISGLERTPGGVRIFFVGGPRGFCERPGKSYLTRRRRGGEGGGGAPVTGGAIP